MQCSIFEQIFEQQPDGPLPDLALAHMDGCQNCRDLSADLGAIRAAALEMGSHSIAPPERVWTLLRGQLEAEGLLRSPAPAPGKASQWSFFQRPALAGVVFAVLVLAASLAGYRQNPAAMMARQAEVTPESFTLAWADPVFSEDLLDVLNSSSAESQDPDVMNALRRNLDIVDNFIALCEKNVREQPGNQMARDYLYGAYEQKAELLTSVMARSTMGGLR